MSQGHLEFVEESLLLSAICFEQGCGDKGRRKTSEGSSGGVLKAKSGGYS